jgi:hypothetical protein
MSRESKIITSFPFGDETTIKHHESFGWELLSFSGKQAIMTRETQNPVYDQLVIYEEKYYNLVEAYKTVPLPNAPKKPKKFDFSIFFILFLCLIIPSVVYVVIKILQNRKYKKQKGIYESQMDYYHERRNKILSMIKETVANSRTLFFARQQ